MLTIKVVFCKIIFFLNTQKTALSVLNGRRIGRSKEPFCEGFRNYILIEEVNLFFYEVNDCFCF